MIVFNLSCENNHLFEGWFASAEAFEHQQKRGLVSCPMCGSICIERRPNAAYVNTRGTGKRDAPSSLAEKIPEIRAADSSITPEAIARLIAMLRLAGKESEDVGKEFADEARRIHQGESEARNIKGQASNEDIEELLDEGILVLPLPPDEGDLH